MAIMRFIVDVEAEGDVTSGDGDDMADKIGKYADSVVGVQTLGNKQGDDKQVIWHVHHSTMDYSCTDCRAAAQDERH